MDPVANEDGFKYYEVTTIDPGVSIILATLLFCALLLAALPCLVKLGERCAERRKASDTDSSGGGSNHAEGNDQASVDHSEIHSVTSAAEIAADAVNAILDSGGPAARRKRTLTGRRDQAIEDRSVVSAMGKLEHDDVSFRDAVDAHDPVYRSKTTTEKGRGAKHRSKMSRLENIFDRLLEIAEWDYETKRIIKLALPFVVQALVMGTSEAARVAVIGNLIGTSEVAAYVVVDAYVGLTHSFLGGYHEALITVCSQAIGARNRRLAGQYVQIAAILYFVSSLPFVAFWMYYTDNILIWLGFDEYTAQIGEEFAKVYVFAAMLQGISETIHELLDVIGLENFSTLIVTLHEIVALVLVVAIAVGPDATLEKIGFAYLFLNCVFFFGTVAVIMYKGWFDRFLDGMIGDCALCNLKAVGVLMRTSASLAFGYLLTYGEWEILTIFASFLGPAEVAAWALLGSLWDAVELVTEAVADAAEVRVAFLLGAAQPFKARMSAYKTFYLGSFLAIFISSILFIMGEDLATWMTKDPTLQRMINDLIPLFGIGNVGLTIGTISWTIVGAQGRYRLSTTVGFLGSWFVTMPLAALSTYVLNIDLQGQTAAVVVGYMVSGTANSYFLLRSDWEKLSEKVIEDNGRWESDSDESSSSSSDSDSDDDLEEEHTGFEVTLDSVERGMTSENTAAAKRLDKTFPTDTSSVASKKSATNRVSDEANAKSSASTETKKPVDEASVMTAGSTGPMMATAPPEPSSVDESFETMESTASQKSPETKSKKKKSVKKNSKTPQRVDLAGQSPDGPTASEDLPGSTAGIDPPADQILHTAPLTPILKRKVTSLKKSPGKSSKQRNSSKKSAEDDTPSTPKANEDVSAQKSPNKSKSKKKGSAEKKAKQAKEGTTNSDPTESLVPAKSLATGMTNPSHVAIDTTCSMDEMFDIVSDLILPDFPDEVRQKALPQPPSSP